MTTPSFEPPLFEGRRDFAGFSRRFWRENHLSFYYWFPSLRGSNTGHHKKSGKLSLQGKNDSCDMKLVGCSEKVLAKFWESSGKP